MLKPHSKKLNEDLVESKVQVKVKREEEEKVGAGEGERSRHGTDRPPPASRSSGKQESHRSPTPGAGTCARGHVQ